MNTQTTIIIFISLIALPLLAGCIGSDEGTENNSITWMTYTDGQKEGKNQEKPILVDLYADWCKPCQQMETDTYTDPAVIDMILEEFIPVKINTDSQPSLAAQYNIQYVPTIIYLTPNGTEVHRTVGYRSASQITADMHTALQNM